jgi:ParB-like chromosome segregation protein Spo0J
MNANTETIIHPIPLEKIEFFIKRRRNRAKWEAMRDSMKQWGLIEPIEVRDIRSLPRDQRKREDGGYYDFRLIYGQGRIEAATDLGWKTIPGYIVTADDLEAAGRFMVENTDRLDFSPFEKGQLIARRLEAGSELNDVAKRLNIGEAMAARYLAAFRKTAINIADEAKKLRMNTLELLTSLPAEGQTVVMEIARETEIPVAEIATRAKKQRKSGEKVTKASLMGEIQTVEDKAAAWKKRLVGLRAQDGYGAQVIEELFANPEFYDLCISEGVDPSL